MILHGSCGTGGIAIGKALLYLPDEPIIEAMMITPGQTSEEHQKFERSIMQATAQIEELRERLLEDGKMDEALIFNAHLDILADPVLINEIKETIEEKVSAAFAVEKTIKKYKMIFEEIADEYLRERVKDIADIGRRLLQNITGIHNTILDRLESPVIIVAQDLAPSDTASLKKDYILGFATDIGGKTSHTAIIARSMGIPAVLGTGNGTTKVCNGDTVILDAIKGIMIVNPDKKQRVEYQKKQMEFNTFQDGLKDYSMHAATTTDGTTIKVFANISSPMDCESALASGGEGVGLYRTEFLYMNRAELPDEEEQFNAYKDVAVQFAGNPVIVRTLDIGGDKATECISSPVEDNPFLGWRAIRICLDHEEIFITQLRAILRASAYGDIAIMYPMISCVSEIHRLNEILRKAKGELAEQGVSFNQAIKVGIMVEIPSVAIMAEIFAKEVDFLSIGTNDLCQYTLAADRMNDHVSQYYQPFHPAILKLIKNVTDAARKQNIMAGMCGEIAGDPLVVPLLLGLGLHELSMSAQSIPLVKKVISSISLKDARIISDRVIQLQTPEQVTYALKEEIVKRDLGWLLSC
jgi:phosphotransferase system enzyme I (PtsI)